MRTMALVLLGVGMFAPPQVLPVREGLRSIADSDPPRIGERAALCGRAVLMTCSSRVPRIQIDVDGRRSDLIIALDESVRDDVAARFDQEYIGREICAEGAYFARGASGGVRVTGRGDIAVMAQPDVPVLPFSTVVTPCSMNVVEPKPVSPGKPHYTSEAMRAKIQGLVVVEAIVETDGTVRDARVVHSLDRKSGIDDEAVKAVKESRFTPATSGGVPVPVRIFVEQYFTLR